jgi:single-stranded-DNA-specific exonuclease
MQEGARWRVLNKNRDGDILTRILANRGFRSEAAKDAFLHPNFERHLHSPYLLKDMDRAVDHILMALRQGQGIVVFGDYDADGVTATALLCDFFHHIQANCSAILPHRINDGYGITPAGVRKARNMGAKLVITVDNGVNALEAAQTAQDLAVDLIITDHHQVGEKLPQAVAIVNPQRHDCTYPEKQISGAGIAYKLVTALAREIMSQEDADHFLKWSLDLVAMGTVADIMPMRGENRAFVFFGLKVIGKERRPGIRALLQQKRSSQKTVNTMTIGYQLGPMINAAGRLEKADIALELLLTQDYNKALDLAQNLYGVNKSRQKLTSAAIREAEEKLNSGAPIILVESSQWHPGIIGLVAGKLCEKYNRPVIAFARLSDEGILKGSARSPHYFDITAAMNSAAHLLDSVGGHRQAGGCTVSSDNFPMFCQHLQMMAEDKLHGESFAPTFEAETFLNTDEMNLPTWNRIRQLAPFGNSNPNPLFLIEDVYILALRCVGHNRQHLQMKIRKSNSEINAIGFNLAHYAEHLKTGETIDLMAQMSENYWHQKSNLQLIVADLRPAGNISPQPSAVDAALRR